MKKIILVLTLLLFYITSGSQSYEFADNSIILGNACIKEGFDLKWGVALVWSEEAYFKNIKTWEPKVKAYSYGPAQILLSTAREMGFKGPEKDLENPDISIPLAVKFMKSLDVAYCGDKAKVIAHYKSGNPNMIKFFKKVKDIYNTI